MLLQPRISIANNLKRSGVVEMIYYEPYTFRSKVLLSVQEIAKKYAAKNVAQTVVPIMQQNRYERKLKEVNHGLMRKVSDMKSKKCLNVHLQK